MWNNSKLPELPMSASGLPDALAAANTKFDGILTTHDTVRAANEIAKIRSLDAPVRALASKIVGDLQNAKNDVPLRVAVWIRANVKYTQETPGVEVLQGPYRTLGDTIVVDTPMGPFQFRGTGTGDCDDLSILFACLCRSVGIPAFIAGIARPKDPDSFFHAMGYCNGQFYELSLDHTYGGIGGSQVASPSPYPDISAMIYDPDRRKYHRFAPSRGENPSASMRGPEPATPEKPKTDLSYPPCGDPVNSLQPHYTVPFNLYAPTRQISGISMNSSLGAGESIGHNVRFKSMNGAEEPSDLTSTDILLFNLPYNPKHDDTALLGIDPNGCILLNNKLAGFADFPKTWVIALKPPTYKWSGLSGFTPSKPVKICLNEVGWKNTLNKWASLSGARYATTVDQFRAAALKPLPEMQNPKTNLEKLFYYLSFMIGARQIAARTAVAPVASPPKQDIAAFARPVVTQPTPASGNGLYYQVVAISPYFDMAARVAKINISIPKAPWAFLAGGVISASNYPEILKRLASIYSSSAAFTGTRDFAIVRSPVPFTSKSQVKGVDITLCRASVTHSRVQTQIKFILITPAITPSKLIKGFMMVNRSGTGILDAAYKNGLPVADRNKSVSETQLKDFSTKLASFVLTSLMQSNVSDPTTWDMKYPAYALYKGQGYTVSGTNVVPVSTPVAPPVVETPPVVSSPPVVATPPVVSSPPVVATPPVVSSPPVVATPPVVETTPPAVYTPPAEQQLVNLEDEQYKLVGQLERKLRDLLRAGEFALATEVAMQEVASGKWTSLEGGWEQINDLLELILTHASDPNGQAVLKAYAECLHNLETFLHSDKSSSQEEAERRFAECQSILDRLSAVAEHIEQQQPPAESNPPISQDDPNHPVATVVQNSETKVTPEVEVEVEDKKPAKKSSKVLPFIAAAAVLFLIAKS
jgi:hypothetical protein